MKTIFASLLAMVICVLLLTVTACIPRDMIQKQSEVSAEYFADREPFKVLIGNYVNSTQDNYSDTILCDIVYCIDTSHPFTSVIQARYAQRDLRNTNEEYLAAVKGEVEVYQEYGRYWHGTMVVLRPLLMVMPIQHIRLLFGIIGTVIQLMLIIALWRHENRAFAVCYAIALLLISPWMFFTSLEYGTTYLTASVAELVFYLYLRDKPDEILMPAFAVVGVVTFFTDFLTTETMTFTLPMLLLLVWRRRTGGYNGATVKDGCVSVIRNGICWFGGYAAMFLLKLLLLAAVAGHEVVSSTFAEGMLRVGGEVQQSNISSSPYVSVIKRLSGAVWHNLGCLFAMQAGKIEAVSVWIPTLIILTIGLTVVYLFHDRIDWHMFTPLWMLALLPYLRFLVLSNHTYIHFFITYRAQMVSVAVFLYFVYENGLRHLVTNNAGKAK